jgi:predicted outer membrane protein
MQVDCDPTVGSPRRFPRNLARHLRLIGVARLLATVLILIAAPVAARNEDVSTSRRETAPAASEVIAELYEFDRFQQDALESADLHGSEGIRNLAVTHADAAHRRDAVLTRIQKDANAAPSFDCETRPRRADLLTALDASEGPDFVRVFYQVEVAEHSSAIDLLLRYLASPDNDAMREFASRELPILVSALDDAKAALDEEDDE